MDFLGRGGGFLFVLLVGDSFFEVVVVFLCVSLSCSISRRSNSWRWCVLK